MVAAASGVWLTGSHRSTRKSFGPAVPFTSGVLIGVALFGIVPEMVVESGWLVAVALAAAGYGALYAVNRFGRPVCPTCAHDHDHDACESELHGFGAPLAAAAAVHSFLDGWSVAAAQIAVPLGLRVAAPLAVMLHKIPEGLALGGILRVSVKSRAAALGWCALAEGTTLAGGAAGLWMSPHLGSAWIGYPLGAAAGWLIYLGYHSLHEERKRRGLIPVATWAAAGVASAALLQRGAEAFLR